MVMDLRSSRVRLVLVPCLAFYLLCASVNLLHASEPPANDPKSSFRKFESRSTPTSDANVVIQTVLSRLENLDQKLKYYAEQNDVQTSPADVLDIHQLFLSHANAQSGLGAFTVANVSESCSAQLSNLFKALYAKQLWSFKVVDSFGKPPSGILQGSLNWLGEFVECRNVTVASINWQSKHCVVSKLQREKNVDPNNFKVAVKYGVCMPMNCSNADIANSINYLIHFRFNKSMDVNADDVICSEPVPFTASAIIAIVIISVIVITVLTASIVDLICLYRKNARLDSESRNLLIQIDDDTITANPDTSQINNGDHPAGENGQALGVSSITSSTTWSISANPTAAQNASFLNRLVTEISIFRNSAKIFKVSQNTHAIGYQSFSQSSGKFQIESLHSVRFLSMAWIILGHSIGIGLLYADNLIILFDWGKWFSFSILTNGFFSVDSFFVLSGALTCFSFMKSLDKPNAKITCFSIFKYLVHRFWRLTPAYMIVLMFNATLSPYLGSGPFYPKDGFEVNQCRDTWWTNLLYINNFVSTDKMCFSMGWYLANDMQFHWVALLILVPFGLGRIFLAFLVSALFLIGNILSISLTLNSNPGSELGIYGDKSKFFSEWVYFKPWTRIGPFIIGILLGYLLFLNKKRTVPSPPSRPITKIICWFVAITFTALCVFGLYPDFVNFPEIKLSRPVHIIYQTFSRLTWAVGLSYIIYACETSTKNLIARVMKLKFWAPLSRLTYSAYLIQSAVILYFYSTLEHPIKLQLQTLLYIYIGNLVMSYAAAYLISVFFEMPFLALEKVLTKKKSQ